MRRLFRRRPAPHRGDRLTECPLCASDCVDAQRYDRDLDRGMNLIAATLGRLDRERMTCEAEALRRDLLDAGDFALRPGDSRA